MEKKWQGKDWPIPGQYTSPLYDLFDSNILKAVSQYFVPLLESSNIFPQINEAAYGKNYFFLVCLFKTFNGLNLRYSKLIIDYNF